MFGKSNRSSEQTKELGNEDVYARTTKHVTKQRMNSFLNLSAVSG